MTDAAEYLEAASDQLDAGEYELAVSVVMGSLSDDLKKTDEDLDRSEKILGNDLAMKAAGEAINKIAGEAPNPKAIEQKVESAAKEVAQETSTASEEITGPLKDAGLVDQIDQHREATAGEGIEVPVGIGLDSYLEHHLDNVVVQRSTDAVDNPKLRWRFSDGARVETSESAHHDYYQFYQKLNAATDKRLVPEVASEQVEEELRDDEEVDGETYGKLSLGPSDRPWHTKNKLWSRAISGLVEERVETVTVTGRRTDAWETLQNRIATGRAVEDLTDAVEHEMVYVDDDAAEVWVPSSFVDKAAETVETSRRAMQAELSERGVTVADHGGGRVSESVVRADTARRFWRFDLDAGAVPEPEEILEEIEEVDGDMLGAVGSDPGDTGSTTDETTEQFGGGSAATDGGEEAPAETVDNDEDADDGTDPEGEEGDDNTTDDPDDDHETDTEGGEGE